MRGGGFGGFSLRVEKRGSGGMLCLRVVSFFLLSVVCCFFLFLSRVWGGEVVKRGGILSFRFPGGTCCGRFSLVLFL